MPIRPNPKIQRPKHNKLSIRVQHDKNRRNITNNSSPKIISTKNILIQKSPHTNPKNSTIIKLMSKNNNKVIKNSPNFINLERYIPNKREITKASKLRKKLRKVRILLIILLNMSRRYFSLFVANDGV